MLTVFKNHLKRHIYYIFMPRVEWLKLVMYLNFLRRVGHRQKDAEGWSPSFLAAVAASQKRSGEVADV
jgi:hypothetical protein